MAYRVHLVGQQSVYPQIAAVLEVHPQHSVHVGLLGLQPTLIQQRTVFQEDVCQRQVQYLAVGQHHLGRAELLIHGEGRCHLLGMTADNACYGE